MQVGLAGRAGAERRGPGRLGRGRFRCAVGAAAGRRGVLSNAGGRPGGGLGAWRWPSWSERRGPRLLGGLEAVAGRERLEAVGGRERLEAVGGRER